MTKHILKQSTQSYIMRSQRQLKTWQIEKEKETQVHLAYPHPFILAHQQQLLPNWNVPISHLILWLQRSSVSFLEPGAKVAQEKDNLRAEFIRFGCDLIFALTNTGYQSDLFDPRTGYPLLSPPGELTLDDSAVMKAVLNYPAIKYQNCSLLVHPQWGNHVYPATIVTSAPDYLVKSMIEQKLLVE